MGFENTTPLTVGIYDKETGERLGELDTLTTITTIGEIEESYGDYPRLKVNDSWSFELHLRRMSRKRFVKKLMGMGFPRNVANTYARACAKNKKPYRWQYWAIVMYDLLK